MNKIKLLIICPLLLISSIGAVFSQEKLNEFVVTQDTNCPFTIRPGHQQYGFVVINTTLSDLQFAIPDAPNRLQNVSHNSTQQYILTIKPNDNHYKTYIITLNSSGFKECEIVVKVKQEESHCFDVNPKNSSILERLAKITVYDKDNKILVGAEVKNRTTGKVYGSTRYDGTLAINFDNKGESTNVIVSHPSYSDTKEITVQAGVHDYEVYLRNYKPSKDSRPSRVSKCKPENFTFEASMRGGTTFGVALDFTVSYFLIGFGADVIVFNRELTSTTSLVNSGYTGNFTKTTTMVLTEFPCSVFIDVGTYFKYFSVSCHVGLLCGTTVNRTSQYDGWGYGFVDGDLDVYWGSYEQRSFTNTTSAKELHLTLTPQIKGYIPVGSNKSSRNKKASGLTLGFGWTLIPALNYYAGFSGSIGVHYRF